MITAKRPPLSILICLLIASAALAQEPSAPPPTIVFMTDYGTVDDSVAICRGVMYGIEPRLRIVDLTHQVTPFAIADAARFLFGTTPYFPPGTVFVIVVDPTVGSSRKAIVVKSRRGQYFVLPDNGLMTMVADRDGVEAVREITNPKWMTGSALSSTFHGRDIFSPVGAHLAHGENWTEVGPDMAMADLVRLKLQPARLDESGISGQVIATDGPFGNLVTNVGADAFEKLGYERGENVDVVLAGKHMTLPFVRTFANVAVGKPLLYIDSRGRVAIALNQRSFAATYGIEPPVSLFLKKNK
jgi:S-adenosylmethionine hydrolase